MPFVNGEFLHDNDWDYSGAFERGYDRRQLRNATRDARDAYGAGDADEAARLLTPYDPQGAQVYQQEGDRAARRAIGDAYGRGDYQGAAQTAFARGDIQTGEAARGRQRVEQFRGVADAVNWTRAEIARIGTMEEKERPGAWQQMFAKAAMRSQSDPTWVAGVSRLRSQFPGYSDEAAATLDELMLQAAQAHSTGDPESYMQNWAAQKKAEAEARRAGLEERKVEVQEGRLAVLEANPPNQGGGNGRAPSGYAWGPDGTLVPIEGGPADQSRKLAGGDAIRASNALASINQIGTAVAQFRSLLQGADQAALLGMGPRGAALTSAHRALALRMKGPAAFDLGALVGADFNILNDTIGEPGNIRQLLTQGGKAGMLARLDEVSKFLASTGQTVRETYRPYAEHPALQQYYAAPAGGDGASGTPASAGAVQWTRDPRTGRARPQ